MRHTLALLALAIALVNANVLPERSTSSSNDDSNPANVVHKSTSYSGPSGTDAEDFALPADAIHVSDHDSDSGEGSSSSSSSSSIKARDADESVVVNKTTSYSGPDGTSAEDFEMPADAVHVSDHHSSSGEGSSSSSSSSSIRERADSGACGVFEGDKVGYASTTRYIDHRKGACGCGPDPAGDAMFPWQLQPSTSRILTAAGSASLFDAGGSSQWLGSGCGDCYELTNTGKQPAEKKGTCAGAGEKVTVMISNLCPIEGNEEWCQMKGGQAPKGVVAGGNSTGVKGGENEHGFGAHFDIMTEGMPAGTWDNPVVQYRKVECPAEMAKNFKTCAAATTPAKGKTGPKLRRAIRG